MRLGILGVVWANNMAPGIQKCHHLRRPEIDQKYLLSFHRSVTRHLAVTAFVS